MKFLMVAIFAGVASLFPVIGHASEERVGVTSSHPFPSPSGAELVFTTNFDGPSRLWISNQDGTNLRKISTNSTADDDPAWSPDGRYIAFSSINGEHSDIWIVSSNGKQPVRLTANGGNNFQPAWSPNSKKIVFVSDKEGSNDIWIMNADGTQQTRIVAQSDQDSHPSFAPTGDKIVFSATAEDASILMVVNVDGSGIKPLTIGKFQDWNPNWGANGIVFSSNRDSTSGHWKIWVIQPDGNGLRKLMNVVALDPIWTKDGRIVFTDELITSRALAAVSILNPVTGTKSVIASIQGYLSPIDIRPDKLPNRLNPNSKGNMEIGVLSTKTFDAAKMVNQSTLTFGRTGDEKSFKHCNKKLKDLNADGLLDLRCRFSLGKTAFRAGDSIGILRFFSVNSVPYEGRDNIILVADEDSDDFLVDE